MPDDIPSPLSLSNGCSVLGRVQVGDLRDRLGSLKVTTSSIITLAVAILALWMTVRNTAGVITFYILFGFFSSAVIEVTPTLINAVDKSSANVGLSIGNIYAFSASGSLAGGPIAGALVDRQGSAYQAMQIFTSVSFLLSTASFLASSILLRCQQSTQGT